jgi:hypothetical protein
MRTVIMREVVNGVIHVLSIGSGDRDMRVLLLQVPDGIVLRLKPHHDATWRWRRDEPPRMQVAVR